MQASRIKGIQGHSHSLLSACSGAAREAQLVPPLSSSSLTLKKVQNQSHCLVPNKTHHV